MKQYVFFVPMQSDVLGALFFVGYVWYFGSLHPAFKMSGYIQYLEKTAFDVFWKRGLRCFVLCAIVLMTFVRSFRKVLGIITKKKTPNSKTKLSTFQTVCLSSALLFSLVLTTKIVLRTS